MAEQNLAAPTEAEFDKLSAREAYWRGRYEESARAQQNLTSMLQSFLWQSSNQRTLSGSIGAGSQIYYGLDPEIVGFLAGLIGIGLGVVGFVVSNVLMGGLGLTFGVALLIATGVLRLRQSKSHSPQYPQGT